MRTLTTLIITVSCLTALCADERATSINRGKAAWAWASACAAVPVKTTAQFIPPGYHAHRRTDGTVLIHACNNLNDPNAHAGVASPWVQIAGAGDKVPADLSTQKAAAGDCPPEG